MAVTANDTDKYRTWYIIVKTQNTSKHLLEQQRDMKEGLHYWQLYTFHIKKNNGHNNASKYVNSSDSDEPQQ